MEKYARVYEIFLISDAYLEQSTPMGRPLMCSGQAPMVKLGAPGDKFRCGPLTVPPDEVGSGVDVVGDVRFISPILLLGDFDGVKGDLSPMFNISQLLQSTPLTP